MDLDIRNILSEEFKATLLATKGPPSFWVADPSQDDIISRKKNFRSAISSIRSSSARVPLSSKTTKILYILYGMSKQTSDEATSTVPETIFKREGYETLVTSKQRLFIREDEPVDVSLNDRKSLGSKLVLLDLPSQVTEEHIVPVLEKFGTLISVRLPLNPRTKLNRGHAFVTFARLEEAAAALRGCQGSQLKGLLTEPSRRLFVRQIPRNRDHQEVQRQFQQMLPGLVKVTMFPISPTPNRSRPDLKNVGYAFLEFQNSHYAKLSKTIIAIIQLLGSELAADWADPKNPEHHVCDLNPAGDGSQ